MKLSKWLRYGAAGAGAIMLITAFQNCGQPGSITSAAIEKGVGTPVDPVDVITPGNPQYKDYEKSVTVSDASNKVDVLVVVDNSGSMNYEQMNMGARFDSFLDKLQGLDWQVGIVTTDMSSENSELKGGNLVAYSNNKYVISSMDGVASAKAAFANTIERDESASGAEQGIRAAYRAIEKAQTAGSRNSQLLRAGAALSVIVVTDADETPGDNSKAGDESTFSSKNFAKNLVNHVTTTMPGKAFKFHSLVVKSNDTTCLSDRTQFVRNNETKRNQNEGYGKQYELASSLTGGIVGSVCETDYTSNLKIIGQSTADQIKDVTLDCAPVDSNRDGMVDLVVTNAAGAAVTAYTVSGRQVSFSAALPVSTYKFKYRCLTN